MNLESLLNNILTSGINFSDPDTIRRIKVLNVYQLVFTMLSPVLGLFYFYIGAIPLFYTCIATGFLMAAGIGILRKTKNIIFVGNYAIFILWLTLFIISWNTGAITFEGVIRPAWILNAGLILLAIFLNGYLSGTIWTVIIFLQTAVVISLYRQGYLFTNLIPPEIAATYSMGTFLICLLAILVFAFLFEKEKSEALIREQEKSHTLRESKKYMDDIFDRYPLPTFILDKSHRVIQWNRACEELTDIPADQIIGKETWSGFNIDDQGSIADKIIDNMDSISEKYSDSIISMSDTGWFEMNMSFPMIENIGRAVVTAAPILDNNGTIRGAIQTIQEISDNSHGQGTIENCLNDNFPNPVFKIDSSGKINFWNKPCEDKFGYSSSEMVGKSPLSLVAKKYQPNFKATVVKALKGISVSDREWRYRNKQGKPAYVLVRVLPRETEEGNGKECIVINTDITELRIKVKKLSLYAAESKERYKNLSEEYDLLKKNIATFIRKKDDQSE
jgi:PAS domain S-box-containing protein